MSTNDPVAVVRQAGENGWRGLAVTMPHKQTVVPLVDEIYPSDRTIGAINTLVFRGDLIYGFNTDVTGILKSFGEHDVSLSEKTVLIIGAGGAARAALAAGLHAGARRIVIVNRNFDRATRLAAEFASCDKVDIEAVDMMDYNLPKLAATAQIAIQTTPVGSGEWIDQTPIAPSWLADDVCLLDVIYQTRATRLMRAVRAKGGLAVGGDRMFLHQAAEQFELWTGRAAPHEVMENALQEATP